MRINRDKYRRMRLIRLIILFSSFEALGLNAEPMIKAVPKTYNFGEIVRGDKVSTIFEIHNSGVHPLEISLVKTSCGCTATFLDSKRILPGGATSLEVKLDSSEFFGDVHKTVFIYSNDPKRSEYALSFDAHVTTLVEVQPARINLGVVNLLEEERTQFPFRISYAFSNAHVAKLEYNKNLFHVFCDPLHIEGTKPIQHCMLSIVPKAPTGSVVDELLVYTSVPEQPVIRVNIRGMLAGAFDVLPRMVDFGEVSTSDTVVERVTITETAGRTFRIRDVILDRAALSYEIFPKSESNKYTLNLQIRPDSLKEVVGGRVRIITDHPLSQELLIKYQAYIE